MLFKPIYYKCCLFKIIKDIFKDAFSGVSTEGGLSFLSQKPSPLYLSPPPHDMTQHFAKESMENCHFKFWSGIRIKISIFWGKNKGEMLKLPNSPETFFFYHAYTL